jgi:putative membrane protein
MGLLHLLDRLSEFKDLKMRGSILAGILAGLVIGAFALATEAQEKASEVEGDLVRQTRAISALSLLASRDGVSELHVPKLKDFANSEVVEQEANWAVFRSSTAGRAAGDTGTPPSNSELEQHLVPLAQQLLQNLRNTDGTGFARQYFLLELNVHQQLLRLQEDYLRLGTNMDYRSIVQRANVLVREHLLLLDDIKNDIDAGKGTVAPGR